MAMKDVADEYFSNLNSIANRIYSNLNETKAAYEDIWNSLSEEEKSQILNETIIKPEICLKYSHTQMVINNSNKKKNEYAMKLIVDDNNCSYRDEHSGPFSFRTCSQRNLTLFNTSDKILNNKVIKESKGRELKTPLLIQIKTEDEEDISDIPKQGTQPPNMPKTGLDLLDNW